METLAGIDIRIADVGDAAGIAGLHADSWRFHYRGAYSARYLDGDLAGERLTVWSKRLAQSHDDQFTLVAAGPDGVVGFAHVVLDADPTWGALIENLHVTRSLHRSGLGTRLLAAAAGGVIERRPASAMYLWVLEQNEPAQAFYAARRGLVGERERAAPPHGDERNLEGNPFKLRVYWHDPTTLHRPFDPVP